MSKIWQKYFLNELLKVFCLFVGCFYFIYVLIDYSIHTKDFQGDHVSFLSIVAYYACQFTQRADILIPVAILIATIKVLTTSNLRHEIVALATGGIALRKIMSPFLWAGTGCCLLLYLNFQCLQPFCLNQIAVFESQFFTTQSKGIEGKPVNALVFEDNTLLIYQTFDTTKKAFFDAYWLKNNDQVERIQSLFPYEKVPYGLFVDTLERNAAGELVKTASYNTRQFPEMHFNPKSLFNAAHPPRMQSITQLARTLGWKQLGFAKKSDREAETAACFFYKLTIPLVCLLAIIAPAPFCLRFSRSLPVYMIYALSLFGLVIYYAIVNSSVIMGESQVIPPVLAILLPQTAFFLVSGLKYAKL